MGSFSCGLSSFGAFGHFNNIETRGKHFRAGASIGGMTSQDFGKYCSFDTSNGINMSDGDHSFSHDLIGNVTGSESHKQGWRTFIEVPGKTSELTNDSGFITIDDVPSGGGGAVKVGEIKETTLEAGNIWGKEWRLCDGSLLNQWENPELKTKIQINSQSIYTPPLGDGDYIKDIICGLDIIFVLTGNGSVILFKNEQFYGILLGQHRGFFVNNNFVFFNLTSGVNTSTLSTLKDGTNWETIILDSELTLSPDPVDDTNDYLKLHYFNDKYWIVSYKYVYSSTDLKNWENHSANYGENADFLDSAVGNDFILGVNDRGLVRINGEGTLSDIYPYPENFGLSTTVCFGDNKFIMEGWADLLYITENGESGEVVSNESVTKPEVLLKLAYSNGLFAYTGAFAQLATYPVAYSYDGKTWFEGANSMTSYGSSFVVNSHLGWIFANKAKELRPTEIIIESWEKQLPDKTANGTYYIKTK